MRFQKTDFVDPWSLKSTPTFLFWGSQVCLIKNILRVYKKVMRSTLCYLLVPSQLGTTRASKPLHSIDINPNLKSIPTSDHRVCSDKPGIKPLTLINDGLHNPNLGINHSLGIGPNLVQPGHQPETICASILKAETATWTFIQNLGIERNLGRP